MLVVRNMFSSEKVLQMSYANYQYVYVMVISVSVRTLIAVSAEEKKLSSRSSRTHASWTNVKHGGPKYSTPNPAPTKVCQNHSPPQPISGEKSAVPSTAGRCLFLGATISIMFPIVSNDSLPLTLVTTSRRVLLLNWWLRLRLIRLRMASIVVRNIQPQHPPRRSD